MQRIVVMVAVAILLSACVPVVSVSPLPTPTNVAVGPVPSAAPTPTQPPKPDTGLVVGQIASKPGTWSGKPLTAYAAPFKPTTAGNGFFILEPTIHPSATVNANGAFQIQDVPPDSYVIVIGPTPEEALAVQEGGQARVVEVKPNQQLDLGKIDLR